MIDILKVTPDMDDREILSRILTVYKWGWIDISQAIEAVFEYVDTGRNEKEYHGPCAEMDDCEYSCNWTAPAVDYSLMYS